MSSQAVKIGSTKSTLLPRTILTKKKKIQKRRKKADGTGKIG